MNYPTSFKDHPASVTELRATRNSDGTEWTPRDALISMLRKIDEGLDVDSLIITYKYHKDPDDTGYVSSCTAAPDAFTALGMLLITQKHILEN